MPDKNSYFGYDTQKQPKGAFLSLTSVQYWVLLALESSEKLLSYRAIAGLTVQHLLLTATEKYIGASVTAKANIEMLRGGSIVKQKWLWFDKLVFIFYVVFLFEVIFSLAPIFIFEVVFVFQFILISEVLFLFGVVLIFWVV